MDGSSSSSTRRPPLPEPIDTSLMPSSNSIPKIPTPLLDHSSFLDSVLALATVDAQSTNVDAEPLREHIVAVEKLSEENIELDKKLREMQRRLEAAERRASMFPMRREAGRERATTQH